VAGITGQDLMRNLVKPAAHEFRLNTPNQIQLGSQPLHYRLLLNLDYTTTYCLLPEFPRCDGSILSNRMAARLSDVLLVHWATPIVLALAVFIIYTVDRLLDIRKPNRPPTARHQFHQQNARLLWRVVAGAAVLGLVLTFLLPGSVIKFGLVLGGICVAYVGAVFGYQPGIRFTA
jgi:hypothetical protein